MKIKRSEIRSLLIEVLMKEQVEPLDDYGVSPYEEDFEESYWNVFAYGSEQEKTSQDLVNALLDHSSMSEQEAMDAVFKLVNKGEKIDVAYVPDSNLEDEIGIWQNLGFHVDATEET